MISAESFIDARFDSIMREWVADASAAVRAVAAGSAMPAVSDLARAAGQAGTELLRALAIAAARENGAGHSTPPALRAAAREYVDRRLEQGYATADLLGDFRALRAALMRAGAAQWLADPRGLAEWQRLDGLVDAALEEALTHYVDGRERARDLFVGALVHDLRSPLGAIDMDARHLLGPGAAADGGKTVRRILNSAGRMRRLVEDMLDFSRVRLGCALLPARLQAVNLGTVCHQALDEVRARFPRTTIAAHYSGELTAFGDPERLSQLVVNLLQNALEHGHADAEASLAVQGDEASVLVSVSNSGPTLSGELLRNMFDPLSRGPASGRDAARGGLGLGLFIADQIVQAHRGRMQVRSEGERTIFFVEMPRGEVGQARTAARADAAGRMATGCGQC